MKRILPFLILSFITVNIFAQSNFLTEQKRYNRVRTAINEKEKIVINKLKEFDIALNELNILILAYKSESVLEIYAKKRTESCYQKLTSYKICSKSGNPGPKRRQGDYQVPEGFYFIDRFNPASNFYLSLGINYPNQSDRKKSKATNLGGDIFIHGNCVTIGCLPMTNDKIKEIYLYAIHAKSNGQKKIPVYIFPYRMSTQNFEKYTTKYKSDKELIDFWTNIKSGYDQFLKTKKELNIWVNKKGDYTY